jgi:spermidine synthase
MHWKTQHGRCIYSNTTENLSVHQNLFYRWLKFGDGPVQSMLNRYRPTKPALEYIKPLILTAQQQPGTTCLLGLGGGAVAHALSKRKPAFPMTAVEYNAHVITVATRYFMAKRLTGLHIVQQDAAEFVQHSTERYQHLIIDLFNARTFPEHCNTVAFFQACQALLTPEGFLAINIIGEPTLHHILSHLNLLFARRVLLIPVKNTSNIIALAYNGRNIQPLLQLVRTTPSIQQLVWDSEWGYVAHIG